MERRRRPEGEAEGWQEGQGDKCVDLITLRELSWSEI